MKSDGRDSLVDKARLRHELMRSMQPWMASEGFTFSGQEETFKRLVGACEQRVVAELRRSAQGWEIHLHFQIRFEAIEDLLNSVKTELSAAEAERSVTIRASLQELKLSDARTTVEDDQPFDGVLEELLTDISTYGLLFFHRWSTVKSIRESYEGDPAGWPESDPIRRCENLLTIYALKGDRQAFDHQATTMLRFMAEHRGGFYQRAFEGILGRLAADPVWLDT